MIHELGYSVEQVLVQWEVGFEHGAGRFSESSGRTRNVASYDWRRTSTCLETQSDTDESGVNISG